MCLRMFTFSFKFLQTSLIIEELIKHDNRLNRINRKVFHDSENSENRFLEFSFFMNIYHEHSSVVYNNETIMKHVFHEML